MVFLYFTGVVYGSLLLIAVLGIAWSPINTTAVIVVIGLAAGSVVEDRRPGVAGTGEGACPSRQTVTD